MNRQAAKNVRGRPCGVMIALCACMGLPATAAGPEADVGKAQQALSTLRRSLETDSISRFEFFYYDPRIMTRVAVTPERLEIMGRPKIGKPPVSYSGSVKSPRIQALIKALRRTTLKPTSQLRGDYRYGFKYYDKAGQVLTRIYLTNGPVASLNGVSVNLNGGFRDWAVALGKQQKWRR
jgi:hypothetical protein